MGRVGLKTIAKNFTFLSESKQYELEDLVEYCEKVEKKKVVHKKIIENQQLVEQNYAIMQLYNPSISLLNRKSIDYTIASFELESNKLNFTKMLYFMFLVRTVRFLGSLLLKL